ncbi:MAG: UPF0262 family protein [Rhodothalassiaceae bacterium]
MSRGGHKPPQRLVAVTLDEASIVRWSADVEHERRVAIFDLLEDNSFAPTAPFAGGYHGPFRLHLRIEDGRLVFELSDESGGYLDSFRLALTPFRRVIKEYFLVCDSYYRAIKSASPQQIEAIDMGRRGLHDEAARLLRERLKTKVEIDDNTARRLFTLICVLHIRG